MRSSYYIMSAKSSENIEAAIPFTSASNKYPWRCAGAGETAFSCRKSKRNGRSGTLISRRSIAFPKSSNLRLFSTPLTPSQTPCITIQLSTLMSECRISRKCIYLTIRSISTTYLIISNTLLCGPRFAQSQRLSAYKYSKHIAPLPVLPINPQYNLVKGIFYSKLSRQLLSSGYV